MFEYVPGVNLGEYLKTNGRLSSVKAATILNAVLDAVGHAHVAGIIHRDLKPSNILIDNNGTPRVMDFGIAARVDDGGESEDSFVGTPCYMAPEYIIRHESSERTDVFSAGLVLYEMLTGQRAIQGNSLPEIIHRLTNEDVRLPVFPGLAIEDGLASILYRSLARDPEQRLASAGLFRQALEEFLRPAAPATSDDAKQSTVDFLLRRMRVKSDFP